MRTRWAFVIAGTVLVVAVVLLLMSSSRPPRIVVRALGQTNDGTCYLIHVTNGTREPQAFMAWIEPMVYGPAPERVSETNGPAIPSNSAHTFTLERPVDGGRKWRIVVVCYPANNATWKRWVVGAKMSLGLQRSKAHKVYLDVE